MAKTINTVAVFNAFDTFASALDNSRAELCKALKAEGLTTREAVQPYAIAWAAKKNGCALKDGARCASGKVVLDRKHARYEAAKSSARRVMEAFEAPEVQRSAHKPDVAVTRAQRAAALVFCAEFEGDSLEAQVRAAIKALRALV